MTTRLVTIPAHFAGPPKSANGGYACGTLAQGLHAEAVEVRLLAPPPLETPLSLTTLDGEATLIHEERTIGVAAAAPPPDPGPTVSWAEAEAARASFDLEEYRRPHPFPLCYVCGSDRPEGAGLRIFPGRTARDEVCAWPWVAGDEVCDEDGVVDSRVLWAALDCPSGLSWVSLSPESGGPIVLARMTVAVRRRPRSGERLVVAGWRLGAAGRKRFAGSSVRTADGDLVAVADTLWVVLDDEQRVAFEAAHGN